MGTVSERVHELVEPVVTASGLELVDVEHGPGLLKITLDREGGIDLDAITKATEAISDLLDVHDPVPGRYTLEVTSPGLERPLRTPDHFKRVLGSEVVIRTQPGIAGDRRLQGVLESADDEAIVVSVALNGSGEREHRRLAYSDVERARTVFEWGPTEKPSNRGSKRR